MIEMDLRNLLPSIFNLFTVTGLAIVGIALMKLLMAVFPIPGLKTLVNAV